MQQRAKENPKIEFIWDSAVHEAYGNEKGLLSGVKVKNVKTGDITDLEVRGDRMYKNDFGLGLMGLCFH
jgi:thioredoxin reductase (NADPH)